MTQDSVDRAPVWRYDLETLSPSLTRMGDLETASGELTGPHTAWSCHEKKMTSLGW